MFGAGAACACRLVEAGRRCAVAAPLVLLHGSVQSPVAPRLCVRASVHSGRCICRLVVTVATHRLKEKEYIYMCIVSIFCNPHVRVTMGLNNLGLKGCGGVPHALCKAKGRLTQVMTPSSFAVPRGNNSRHREGEVRLKC